MKVAFFDTKPDEKKYLENHLTSDFERYYFSHSLNCSTAIDDSIKNSEIISVFIESNLTKKVLEKFPNLKFIVLRSTGYSHVDLYYAKEHGISIFNAPHYGDYSIAEYVFTLILSVTRRIIQASSDIKNFDIFDVKYQGIELFNKTIGIVGLGAIGKKVAQIASGFSMDVICYDINKTEGYNFVSIEELCKKSDVISINCPLNENTLHLIDKNKFELMKEGVIIVNAARGEIIKTADLYEALISKKIGCAALDVAECENVLYEDIENPVDINSIKENCFKNFYIIRKLLNMPNVIITPHIAYNTKEAGQRILEITVQNLSSSLKFTNGAKNLVLI